MKRGLVVISLIWSISCFGQSDFREGFIVQNGKTTFGHIDYRSLKNSYESCRFKKSNGETIEYLPNQIEGYGFVGDRFFSSGILNGVFVEKIFDGDVDLFRYQNIFFMKKESELYRLEKDIKPYTSDFGGVRETKEVKSKWRGYVTYLLSDCLNAPYLSQNLDLSEPRLIKVLIKYHECIESDYVIYEANKPWFALQYGVQAGVAQNTISFLETAGYPHLEAEFNSTNPYVGLAFIGSLPRSSERFAFQIEAQFSKAKYFELITRSESGVTSFYDTYFETSTLSIPFSGRLDAVKLKNSALYLQVGIIVDVILESDSYVRSETVSNGVVTTSPKQEAYVLNKFQNGYWGGLGIRQSFNFMEAHLTFRYHIINNESESEDLKGSADRASIGIFFTSR